MTVTIRTMKEGDLHRGLLETLATLSEVGLMPDAALAVHRRRDLAGVRTFVAESEDRVVGTLTLLIEQKFIHAGGLVGHIEDVAVHKDHQGKGIGKELVLHAVEESKKAGCYKVILDCFEELVPFYSALGFRRFNVGMRVDV